MTERPRHVATGVALALIKLLAAAAFWMTARQIRSAQRPLLRARCAAACREAYALARTAPDSAAVDGTRPVFEARAGARASTCGALRAGGSLR